VRTIMSVDGSQFDWGWRRHGQVVGPGGATGERKGHERERKV
jgi:hypothetical protein